MRTFALLLFGLGILASNAQQTPPSESLEALTVRRAEETALTNELKPNEIKAGPVSYSGIAVEVVKVDNLFELINPAAPAEYGFAEQNVVRDPADNKISGLKFFSIQF